MGGAVSRSPAQNRVPARHEDTTLPHTAPGPEPRAMSRGRGRDPALPSGSAQFQDPMAPALSPPGWDPPGITHPGGASSLVPATGHPPTLANYEPHTARKAKTLSETFLAIKTGPAWCTGGWGPWGGLGKDTMTNREVGADHLSEVQRTVRNMATVPGAGAGGPASARPADPPPKPPSQQGSRSPTPVPATQLAPEAAGRGRPRTQPRLRREALVCAEGPVLPLPTPLSLSPPQTKERPPVRLKHPENPRRRMPRPNTGPGPRKRCDRSSPGGQEAG